MDHKPLSPWHLWIRARRLEGTLGEGPEVGAWCISAQRISKGWGVLNDEDFPFDTRGEWPPKEMEHEDEKSKPNRIWCYQRVQGAADACDALDRNHAIVASFNITDQWFNANDGVIDYPPTGKLVGGHAVAFAGYSSKINEFDFINSWGVGWGHDGHGQLSFEFFNDFMTEAFTSYWGQRAPLPLSHRINFVRYGYKGFADSVIHICEAYSHLDNDVLGWSFAVQRGGFLEIEELFVKPIYRRKGLGAELCRMVNQVKAEVSLPHRAWIPHADSYDANLPALDAALRRLGLERLASPNRWASFVGVEPGAITQSGTVATAPSAQLKIYPTGQ